jgi:TRAP-type C4-dicarboxylate transport system permease large subunit
MNQTILGVIIILAMGVTFFFGFRKKVPVGIIMIMASIVGSVIAGFGIPLRHFVEGSFYFLYLMLQIITGMLLIKTMEATGALEMMTHTICAVTARLPSLLLAILAVFVMFPAMLTGSTPVAVLTTGVLVAYTLLRIGVPKLETAAIVGFAALCGQSAPPVNVMVMIICTSTFMPYEGFGLPLALTTFPLAIFAALYMGRKHVKSEALLEMAREDREAGNLASGPQFLKLSLPLIVLVLFMIIPRVFPFALPDPNTPFMFVVCTLIALFTGVKRANFLTVSRDTVEHGLTVLTLFIGMGVLVHVMSLTGVKGLLATTVVALPKAGLYLSTLIGPPLLGGPVVPFGVSAIIGPPLVLAFAYKDSIIATSAISLLLSLGCLFPPTALSSLFAARVVGIDNYMTVTKRCVVPALVMAAVAMLVLTFADPIARLLGGMMPSGY